MEGMDDKTRDMWLEGLEKGILQSQENKPTKDQQMARLQEVLKTYEGEDKVISSHELELQMANEPEEYKMLSGLKPLDDILEGFRPQQLIVLSGLTKHGKTSLAMDLITNLGEHSPLLLPFEETAKEIIRRFHDRGEKTPLFYTPQHAIDRKLEWIEKRMIESKVKYASKIVFIDHLGYIVGDQSQENKSYQIEDIMKTLKTLAKQLDMIIVLLAHLSQARLDRKPDLTDLKGSSAIAQEADTVMLLWRDTKRENGEIVIGNEATLSIQANRRTGKTGNVHLIFNNGRYVEVDKVHEDVEAF